MRWAWVLLFALPSALPAQEAGAQAQICRNLTGCHKDHGADRIDCPKCAEVKVPKEDAACTTCSAMARICRHCGLPRTLDIPRSAGAARPQKEEPIPTLRVLLDAGTDKSTVECKGPVEFTVPDYPKAVLSAPTLSPTEIVLKDGKFEVGGKQLDTDWVTLVCKNPEAPVQFAKRQYVGEIHFVKRNNDFQIVSEVDVEQYLMGVVGPEIGYDTNIEALKVQAICARSYAWAPLEGRKLTSKNRPAWDLYDDTRSQVYLGVPDRSYSKVKQAVDATKGLMVTYKGKVVRTYFSSACGGATRKAGDIPPLGGVPCGFCRRPKYGHSQGLCQWGAMNMANEGWTSDRILGHYFPQSEIVSLWGPLKGKGTGGSP